MPINEKIIAAIDCPTINSLYIIDTDSYLYNQFKPIPKKGTINTTIEDLSYWIDYIQETKQDYEHRKELLVDSLTQPTMFHKVFDQVQAEYAKRVS